jgi:hypothetical protein
VAKCYDGRGKCRFIIMNCYSRRYGLLASNSASRGAEHHASTRNLSSTALTLAVRPRRFRVFVNDQAPGSAQT